MTFWSRGRNPSSITRMLLSVISPSRPSKKSRHLKFHRTATDMFSLSFKGQTEILPASYPLTQSQIDGAAQHFRRVSADSNVGDLLTVAFRANKDFTGSSGFDALVNENLLVRFCHAMPHHPTNGTT